MSFKIGGWFFSSPFLKALLGAKSHDPCRATVYGHFISCKLVTATSDTNEVPNAGVHVNGKDNRHCQIKQLILASTPHAPTAEARFKKACADNER